MTNNQLRYLLTFALIGLITLQLNAQEKFKELSKKNDIHCFYKIKALKNDENRIVIKFKNHSTYHQMVELKVGLYLDGVLEEEAVISSCLKNGIIGNSFSKQHAIINEQITSSELISEDLSIEVLELNVEKTEACEKASH